MKKIILAALAIAVSLTMAAQGKVSTRKYVITDFSDKITKVVLPGSGVLDGALRSEITKNWTISAYEFCSVAEFEKLKKSSDYYFLLTGESLFKGEQGPGILFLTLVKGGSEAGEGTSGMHEVVSIPLCSSGISSGRELVFLGAMVEAVQSFTYAAMESEKVAYLRDRWFNEGYAKLGKMMTIYLASEDISESVNDASRYLDGDFYIVPEDNADGMFLAGSFNTLCSYTVAPFTPTDGASYSYTMLFEAGTRRLCYLHRHKITAKEAPGFTDQDLRTIKKGR